MKLKNILGNKDVKSLAENFISLSVLQIFGIILPLVTLPYVLRTLGFEKYGLIVLAMSLVAYFQSVTDYSFKITATRDIAIFKNSKKKVDLIYSKVITIKAIFLILSSMIILGVVYLYPPFYKERLVFFLTLPMLLGYVLFPEWFFQGIEKMKFITYLNIGIKFFFTGCVFLFIKNEEDYWKYPLFQSMGYIGAGFIGQFILIHKYHLKFKIIKFNMIKNNIKANFPIFLNQFSPTLYNNTSTFLLGVLTNTNLVGIYDAIKKITDLCVTLINIVSRVCFPYLNRNKKKFTMYKKVMIVTGFIMCLLPIIFHKIIFYFLNIDYPGAINILGVLSLSIFFISLYDIFGLNYFIVNRKDKIVMTNTILASITGLVLAYPLIFFFGIIGAAVNLTLARFIMGFGLYYKYRLLK